MKNITETLGLGSRAPEFRLIPANTGEPRSLSDWTSKGAVVLEFLRGTWCHSCRKRLPELHKIEPQVWQSGANIVCIAPEKRGGVWNPEEYLRNHHITLPFLLDEDREVIKAYGLYHKVGIDAWNTAYPATLVIDRDNRVRYIYKGESQSDGASMEEILKAVRKIAG